MKIRILLLAIAALGFASVGVRADDQPIEVQLVDAMNKVFGTHPGFRANHAKGVVAVGSFTGSAEAGALSRAVLFTGKAIPITVRFSDSTGIPDLPDGAAAANPHGIAIKFHLPGGGETDMVMNSLKFFPAATGAEFRDMLLALAASPPGAAKPTPFDKFAASHPQAPAAFATAATPNSYADEGFWGIDAFVLVNKDGQEQAVRYEVVPERVVHRDAAEAGKRAPDFLSNELAERLQHGPVTFHLKAQLAAPGDSTKDPSQPWPYDRREVELGVLTIYRLAADSLAAQTKLVFLPGALTDGIKQSDDPLINVRTGAYAVSFSRRNP